MKPNTRTGSTALLAVASTIVLLTLGTLSAPAAFAAEPSPIGQDGQSLVLPGDVMSITEPGPQGQLEVGAAGSFYSALWSGSGAKETLIYRYFEDGTDPVTWDTNAESAVKGKVFSLSTDSARNVFSLHRTAQLPANVSIAKWTPDGALIEVTSASIPGANGGQANAMAVSADGTTAFLRVDAADPSSLNGIWSVSLASGAVAPILQGLATTPNAAQTPFLQVDHVSGAIGFALDTATIGVIADPVGAPSVVTEFSTGTDSIRGFDMTKYSSGSIFVTAGTNVKSFDVASSSLSNVVGMNQLNFFNPYASRWGTDGRLYISGFSPWGVLPVDFIDLKSPEISYPLSTVTTNVCAPVDISLTPQFVGSPDPTWVSVSAGSLPEGVDLDSDTGKLSGIPAAEGAATLQAKNGVSMAWNSEPDTFDITFTKESVPVAFTSAPAPVIAGTPKVGNTLSASVAAWSPDAALSYQWFRDDVAIPGASGLEYKLTPADANSFVTLAAKGTAECRISATAVSAGVDISEGDAPLKPPVVTPPADASPEGPQQGGPLADTGGNGPLTWLIAGAALVAAGGVGLLIRSRRSK